jgi:hypothetical protein
MGKRKSYQVFYADRSDDEADREVPQARVVSVQKHGRLLVASARSPQKRGVVYQPFEPRLDAWEPCTTFDVSADDSAFDNGFDWIHEDVAEGPTVAARASAKRYPTSVSETMRVFSPNSDHS